MPHLPIITASTEWTDSSAIIQNWSATKQYNIQNLSNQIVLVCVSPDLPSENDSYNVLSTYDTAVLPENIGKVWFKTLVGSSRLSVEEV